MDPLAIILGLFILAALIKNKELSGDKDKVSQENKEIFDYLIIFVFILILGGLGFLFGSRFETPANASLLVPLYVMMIPFAIFAKGPSKVIIKAGMISIFIFIVLFAYM